MIKNGNPILIFIGICLFCFLAIFLSAAQENKYETLLGEWDVQTEDGQYQFVFVFSMEGEVLKGMYQGTTGDVEMEDLTFENNQLSFTVNIDAGGQTMVIDYNATIEGDTLEGFLSLEYGEANITGKKRK
jgi:hypothetical protein